jgi:CHASE3 domain sensor protein
MMTNNDPPLKRMQNNLVGFLGVAFELVRANPSLDLTEQEIQKLNEMERPIQLFRKGQIEVVSKLVKDSFNGQDESTEALRKALSDMHLRVTETSVFDMEEKCNRSG